MDKERKKVWSLFWLGFVIFVGGLIVFIASEWSTGLLPTLVGGILVVSNGIKLKFKKPDNQ